MASKPKSRLTVFRHRRTSDGSLQTSNKTAHNNNNNNNINGLMDENPGSGLIMGKSSRRATHSSVNLDNKTDDSDDCNKLTDDEPRVGRRMESHHRQRAPHGKDEEDFDLDPLPERDERFWYSANDISLSKLSPNVTTNAPSASSSHPPHHHHQHHHHQQQRRRPNKDSSSSSTSSLSSTEAITRERRLAKALLHLHIQAAENVVASANAKQMMRQGTVKKAQLSPKGGNKKSGHDDADNDTTNNNNNNNDRPTPLSIPSFMSQTKGTRRKRSKNAIDPLDSLTRTTVNPTSSLAQHHHHHLHQPQVHMNPNGLQLQGEEDDIVEEEDNWENESIRHQLDAAAHHHHHHHHNQHEDHRHTQRHIHHEPTIEIKLSSPSSSSSQEKPASDHSKPQQPQPEKSMKNKKSNPILLHYHHNKLEEPEQLVSKDVNSSSLSVESSSGSKKRRARSLSLPERIWNELLGRATNSKSRPKRHSAIETSMVMDSEKASSKTRKLEENETQQQQQQQQFPAAQLRNTSTNNFQNNTYRLSAPTFPIPPPSAFSDRSMDSLLTMSSIVQVDPPHDHDSNFKRDKSRWYLFSFRRGSSNSKSKRKLAALPSARDHIVLANSVRSSGDNKCDESEQSATTNNGKGGTRRKSNTKENRKLNGDKGTFPKDVRKAMMMEEEEEEESKKIGLVERRGEHWENHDLDDAGDDGSRRRRSDCEIVSMDLDQGPGLSKKSSGGFLKSFRLKKNKVGNGTDKSVSGGGGTMMAGSGDSRMLTPHRENDRQGRSSEINVNVWNKTRAGTDDKSGVDDNNKNKLRRSRGAKKMATTTTTMTTKKNPKKESTSAEREKRTSSSTSRRSANIFQAFYYAGRRQESVTAKDFDDVTLDLASGELKKTKDGTVIVENATEADVDIVPGPPLSRMTLAGGLLGGGFGGGASIGGAAQLPRLPAGSGGAVKEIAHDVTNIHNDNLHGQNPRVREIPGNHRGFRVGALSSSSGSNTTGGMDGGSGGGGSSSSSSSREQYHHHFHPNGRPSNVTNGMASAPVTSVTKEQDPAGNNPADLYAYPVKVTKNPSEDNISSIIPASSTLVTQQLLTFDSGGKQDRAHDCRSRASQTEAQILVHHHNEEREGAGRTGDEDSPTSISPSKSLLGRVKDLHRNGVFSFGSSSGSTSSSSSSPRGSQRHKSASGAGSNANHMPGRNNGGCSSSNDFYGRPNAPTFNQDNLPGQSYHGAEDEVLCVGTGAHDDGERNDGRPKSDRGGGGGGSSSNGGGWRWKKMTRADGSVRNDELLSGSQRNSSEEELTSINNPSVVRPSTSAPTAVSGSGGGVGLPTTSVAMALPPTRRPNHYNSAGGGGSMSDCDAISTTSTTGSSLDSYNGPFVGKAVALVDCTPSPYDRHALRYKKGDVIEIISKKATGSWTGKVNNQVGHFKFINVQVLPEADDPVSPTDVFDMDYEGDYSRDEDYYYNNCTRGGGYESDNQSGVSSIRRRHNHRNKPSLLTPWQLEQRQTVASVINGIRKENRALRRRIESSGRSSPSSPTGGGAGGSLESDPPPWNGEYEGDPGGGGKVCDRNSLTTTRIPAVKRTGSSSEETRRGSKGSTKGRKEKKGRPKSVGDLLQRIHLQDYISVFILHGFESLDLFKELEEEDLDRLAILNGADRAKILTAAELLREYDTEEEIPIPMIMPPAPPPLPPPSSESTTTASISPASPASSLSRAFPRDSGIFVKCEEDGEGEHPDGLMVSSSSGEAADERNEGLLSSFNSNDALGNANFSLRRKEPEDEMRKEEMKEAGEINQTNGTTKSEPTIQSGGQDEELILSPLNLHKIQVGGPTFSYVRPSSPEGVINPSAGQGKNQKQADLFGDVKQRFLNAKTMFEMASNTTTAGTGSSNNSVNKNRFSYDKSSDSGISCAANSPPLLRTDY